MHVNDVVNKKKWKVNKIMERICILAFHGINSWKDIRTREVSLLSIVVFGIVGMAAVNMKDGLVKLLKKDYLTHGINVTIDDENKIIIDFHVFDSFERGVLYRGGM